MSRHPLLPCLVGLTLTLTLTLSTAAPAHAAADALPEAVAPLVERALPDVDPAGLRDGRDLFEAVLASDLFVSGTAGPFELHVLADEGGRDRRDAARLLDEALEGLGPAAELIARLWPEGGGSLVSGARLHIVLSEDEVDGLDHQDLVSLLGHCEREGYSGWAPVNEVDTPARRSAEVVRTWEVQLFDLDHATIADRRDEFLEHGLGYYSLAFVANLSLRRGSWGLVPPWLAHGLTDELDIAAYGQAWVGQESWSAQTPGWFRPGWSGFVPQGHQPPPPVTGPSANLATTVMQTGDPWLSFDASTQRHWSELVVDMKAEAPMSFARSAQLEAFLPRDRAAARCLLHLMLQPDAEAPLFTSLLDTAATTRRDGMPDSEALPVLFALSLGGVPEVERLESLSTRQLLTELGRQDLIVLLEGHGAEKALEMSDHREQSKWLSRRGGMSVETRTEIFHAFLEVEWVQQLAEWRAMGPHLDAGLRSALRASRSYPRRDDALVEVTAAFRAAVARDPATMTEADDDTSRGASRLSSNTTRSKGRRRR